MRDALAGLRRIHEVFYAEGRDVTDPVILAELAGQLGFDEGEFRAEFGTEAARAETRADFALTQEVGVSGFPTLLAGNADGRYDLVTQGFRPSEKILPALETWWTRLQG